MPPTIEPRALPRILMECRRRFLRLSLSLASSVLFLSTIPGRLCEGLFVKVTCEDIEGERDECVSAERKVKCAVERCFFLEN